MWPGVYWLKSSSSHASLADTDIVCGGGGGGEGGRGGDGGSYVMWLVVAVIWPRLYLLLTLKYLVRQLKIPSKLCVTNTAAKKMSKSICSFWNKKSQIPLQTGKESKKRNILSRYSRHQLSHIMHPVFVIKTAKRHFYLPEPHTTTQAQLRSPLSITARCHPRQLPKQRAGGKPIGTFLPTSPTGN